MKQRYLITFLVLSSFILSTYFYPQVPEKVASHWNTQGEVDGYMSRFWGVFFFPFILLGIVVLFTIIPFIDPLKENIKLFRRYYDNFIIFVLVFFLLVQLQVLLWNIGVKISPNKLMPLGVGILIYYAGVLTENAKRNWFIGIRTPWTLSSDAVWDKTHRIGGKLFKIAGIITVLGIFTQQYCVYCMLIPILAASGYSVIYSYLEYQKEQNKN